MLFRNLRKVSTGEWVDVLFSVDGDAFDVPEISHRTDIAAALGLLADDLETLDSASDQRTGALLAIPGIPGPDVLSYEEFESRFTDAEKDGISNFVYGVDVTTGTFLRPKLVQAYNRAVARNNTTLSSAQTGAFFDALVDAGVLTAARKAEVLAP